VVQPARCPKDFEYRNVVCKHIWAVEISLTVRKEVEAGGVESISYEACIYSSSDKIIRWGTRQVASNNTELL
jgi:hypothetical protein